MVAQLVGHTHKNITFGKYGKKFPVRLLLKKLSNLNFSIEQCLIIII